MSDAPVIPVGLALKRGMLCVCPKCGHGKIYAGILKPAKQCSACGLDYSFFDTGDGAAVFGIMIIGFLVTGAALYAHFSWAWPVWLHIIVWPVIVVLLSILIQRPIKACLITLQYANKAGIAQFEDTHE